MTLWMLRLSFDPNALSKYAAERGWMTSQGFDEGQTLHHLLVETFGTVPSEGGETRKGAFRPFRLLVTPGGRASLYGYATLPPETLRETAETIAPPEALALLPPDRLQAKPMPGTWRAGQLLGFDLKVRPTVRLASAIPAGPQGKAVRKGAEIDAWLAHELRAWKPEAGGQGQKTREDIYRDWLAARLAPAAELLPDTCRLTKFRRSKTSRNTVSEGPEALFQGTLRIAEPEAFSSLLRRGVGRHCAYGFGMLLLRAPGR